MSIDLCTKCGFILNTRPSSHAVNGVCLACINIEKKEEIDFAERQEFLTKFISEHKGQSEYDCLVAVSGGKDSTVIVSKLFEKHGIQKALLLNIADCFTQTETGKRNFENLINRYNVDLIKVVFNRKYLAERMKKDLEESLNPLQWLEQQIYLKPLEIARQHHIPLVFYGENSDFEYGSSTELKIFHPASTDELKVIYMGAIYPYSGYHWYREAQTYGFKDLNVLNEWQRQGNIENYSQIDSLGYLMGIWTKFVKFGFQRVSDVACRLVRDGLLEKEQALQLIRDQDYICDPTSKRDFCRAIGISEAYFDEMVDKHANKDLVVKDINGVWRRKDLL